MNLSLRALRPSAAALMLLAVATAVLYHDALAAYWRADDGAHLEFVSWYAPWQYFFIPEVTRDFSSANVTPWNAFTYSINLALFGLEPAGFYAHQLASLWLTAAATFMLLRLWLPPGWSLFGAMLFLAGAPSAHVANELMTGHYLEGLLFAICATYCHVLALRKGSHRLAIAGAAFYLLAATCKEVYVPLPAILLFLPEGDWRARMRMLVPFAVVACGYVAWRVAVLGALIGGYNLHHSGYAQAGVARQLASIPLILFGKNAFGYGVFAGATAITGWTLWKAPRYLPFVLVTGVLVVAPLVPLTVYPGIAIADRYLFLVWWIAAVLLAIVCAGRSAHRYVRGALAAAILLAATANGRAEHGILRDNLAPYEAFYRFAATSRESDVLLLPSENRHYLRTVLNGIVDAQRRRHPSAPPRSRRFVDEQMLPLLDGSAMRIFRYDPQCRCLRQVPGTAPRDPDQVLAALRGRSFALDALQVGPPYREIRHIQASAGQIESVEVAGDSVDVVGWARLRDDSLAPYLIVGVPVLPVEKQIIRVQRADIAAALDEPLLAYSGFRVRLKFGSADAAGQSARWLCMVSGSDQSVMTLLSNPRNPACSQLLPEVSK